MRKVIFILFFTQALLSKHVSAHNSQISSLRISKIDTSTYLDMSAALAAFHYELQESHPELDFGKLGAAELIPMLLQHVQSSIAIVANGKHPILLTQGLISPGHQTDLHFTLVGMPEEIQSLSIHLRTFAANPDHIAICMIGGNEKAQTFFLQASNTCNLRLIRNELGLFEESEPTSGGYAGILGGFGVVLFLILVLLFVKRRLGESRNVVGAVMG